MGLEAAKAFGPFGVRGAEPVVDGEEAVELQSRRTALTVADPADETGPLEHLEVLGDGRLTQRRGLGELDNTSLAGREALEDRPASGVGEGGESAAQGIGRNHYREVI